MKKSLSIFFVLVFLMFVLGACSDSNVVDDNMDVDNQQRVFDDEKENVQSEIINICDMADVEIITDADGNVSYNGLTVENLENSLPKEHIPEKMAAGMEVTVAISFYETSEAQNRIIFDGMIEDLEAEGFNVIYADAGGDQLLQVNQLENFIEMEPSLIACFLSDVDTYSSPCEKAKEAGIFFYLQGSWADYEPSGQEYLDQGVYGEILGNASIAWLDHRYPDAEQGSIHTAFLCTTFTIDNVNCINAIEQVWATDPRINVVYKNENIMQLDEGFSAAEEAFTMDPSIKLVQTITPNAAIGANNYIISNPDLVLDEIGICMRGDNEQTQMLLEQGATNDGSCFRTKGGAGGNYFWESPMNICMDLLMGVAEEPYVYYARFYVDSNFGFEYDSRPA